MSDQGLSRRGFLKVSGSGIFLSFVIDALPDFAKSALAQRPPEKSLPTDFNAFLRIAEDGRVTCFTGKVEYGQGVNTSLRMMLADELDVAFEATDIVMGTPPSARGIATRRGRARRANSDPPCERPVPRRGRCWSIWPRSGSTFPRIC